MYHMSSDQGPLLPLSGGDSGLILNLLPFAQTFISLSSHGGVDAGIIACVWLGCTCDQYRENPSSSASLEHRNTLCFNSLACFCLSKSLDFKLLSSPNFFFKVLF